MEASDQNNSLKTQSQSYKRDLVFKKFKLVWKPLRVCYFILDYSTVLLWWYDLSWSIALPRKLGLI